MGNIITEADGAGAIQRDYVYVNGECLALLQKSPTQAMYCCYNDHLGTPKALTSTTVVRQADYTPFGELTETVSIVERPFRFPGQYFDGETELYYNYCRGYYPGLGRYVQSDPMGLFQYESDGGAMWGAWFEKNVPQSPIGPFGGVCGQAGTYLATWIPDHVKKGCEEHDRCYVGCAKSCKGESCRKKCDIALAGHSPFYGYALYGGLGKAAFNAVKEKYKEQCEGCEQP
ncbi:RHS repeat domain-containing protein [Gilvimarinus agarilyticus]|uniref:RHS repeat domain-containing protein n=1 Tax=Gilvimarinus agarilyticus TaxID=679259 RepID=UPI0005A039E7|nr:RHS repeat-associated core domain-containing protein [Gilvimarinus agarilyticus]